ncbi:hypothetical protein, partial [Winogradskyella poriferorum]|uniref:hypothetical protein n=1 Tax=Winogradskyella poriferorum TaxID=307627 RepID=UPI003D65CC87
SVQEDGPEQPLLRFKDGDTGSGGLLDEEVVFDENSEVLRTKKESFSVKTTIDCTPDLLDTGYSENVNIEVINKPGDNGYF